MKILNVILSILYAKMVIFLYYSLHKNRFTKEIVNIINRNCLLSFPDISGPSHQNLLMLLMNQIKHIIPFKHRNERLLAVLKHKALLLLRIVTLATIPIL